MAKGGYRINAGRPKGSKTKIKSKLKSKNDQISDMLNDFWGNVQAENLDPLDYMLKIMNDPNEPKERRDRMAIAAAPFCHAKATEGKGKKQEQEIRAKAACAGKFAAGKPPLKLLK